MRRLPEFWSKIGWDVIDWRLLKRVHRQQREHLVVMLATLGLTVFVDLVTAVAVGLIAAGMAHARQLERLELDGVVSLPFLDEKFLGRQAAVAEADPYSARVGLVALKGSLTVASSHKLVAVIGEDIKDHEVVIFDFSGTSYLDECAAMVIEQLLEVATKEGTAYILMGLSGTVAHTLHTLNILQQVAEDQVVETLDEARRVAYELLSIEESPVTETAAGAS